MTVLSFRAGAASEMIAAQPCRRDLTAKQLAWCRRRLRGFKACERAALRVRREAERSREEMEDAR